MLDSADTDKNTDQEQAQPRNEGACGILNRSRECETARTALADNSDPVRKPRGGESKEDCADQRTPGEEIERGEKSTRGDAGQIPEPNAHKRLIGQLSTSLEPMEIRTCALFGGRHRGMTTDTCDHH